MGLTFQDTPNLVPNYSAAKAHLMKVMKKLKEDEWKAYRAAIELFVTEDDVERVYDSTQKGKMTYYLPHRPVFTPQRLTTKCRPVYNASAKTSNGLSQNDFLHVGPCLHNDIVKLLLSFRKRNTFCLVTLVECIPGLLSDHRIEIFFGFFGWTKMEKSSSIDLKKSFLEPLMPLLLL